MGVLKSICLIGPMGAGKTTVGKQLADFLKLDFVDTDLLVQQQLNSSIVDIFRNFGEKFFRLQESQVLSRSITAPPRVIATGGGCILDPRNRQLLKQHGMVCYLAVSPVVQRQRLAGCNSRPLHLLATMADRAPLYASVADFSIDTDKSTPFAIVEQLHQAMHQRIGEHL